MVPFSTEMLERGPTQTAPRLWGEATEEVEGLKRWRVVKNLYSEVGSCVRLEEEKTDWFGLEIGLRQGCILSPILFSIFIDGLAEEVKKVGGVEYGEIIVSLCCLLMWCW